VVANKEDQNGDGREGRKDNEKGERARMGKKENWDKHGEGKEEGTRKLK
jgi:hypothetical protein